MWRSSGIVMESNTVTFGSRTLDFLFDVVALVIGVSQLDTIGIPSNLHEDYLRIKSDKFSEGVLYKSGSRFVIATRTCENLDEKNSISNGYSFVYVPFINLLRFWTSVSSNKIRHTYTFDNGRLCIKMAGDAVNYHGTLVCPFKSVDEWNKDFQRSVSKKVFKFKKNRERLTVYTNTMSNFRPLLHNVWYFREGKRRKDGWFVEEFVSCDGEIGSVKLITGVVSNEKK